MEDVDFIGIQSEPSTTNLPRSYYEAMRSPDYLYWREAMEAEVKKLTDMDAWDLVTLPPGKRAIDNKWVYSFTGGAKKSKIGTTKEHLTPTRQMKARLVARGDRQIHGIDYDETYAPVIKLVSLRIMLTIAALKNLDLKHWDIVAAFVNGQLTESVYMRQPIGFEDGTSRVCLLKSSLYGLCQSARTWYQRLDEILAMVGWKRLHSDYAIWIAPSRDEFVGAHVDDMAVAARKDTRRTLKQHLRKFLQVTILGDLHLYVGLKIDRNREINTIYLTQSDYTRKVLKMFSM